MKVGYARVSSYGQSLDIQLSKLTEYGCERIFSDKVSGTTQDRPQMLQCLDFVREGDQLVITKLDRLARSTFHLTKIAKELEARKVELIVLDQNIDTSTPTGRLLFNVLASIAEFENEIRQERQQEGLKRAKEKGIKLGAKPKLSAQQIETMLQRQADGETVKTICHCYSISQATFYRLRKEKQEKDKS